MIELPLSDSRSVILDANGEATVIGVGPVRFEESWVITLFSVSTSSRCTFTVHRGNDPTAQYQIDGTAKGDLDTSDTNIALLAGQTISFKWSDGTPGATGSVRFEGTIKLRGRY